MAVPGMPTAKHADQPSRLHALAPARLAVCQGSDTGVHSCGCQFLGAGVGCVTLSKLLRISAANE